MSAFRQSLPLLITIFVNRCGTIGLSLLPMLLVERQIDTASAATAMGIVKAAGVVGVLAGGFLADRFRPRMVVLLAMMCQGIGLGLLPWMPFLALIVACGVLTRLGDALFKGPSRLLLSNVVPPSQLQESIGWLRSTGNAGQIVSYGLGTVFAAFGVAPLMIFDAITSLLAAALGTRLLPAESPRQETTKTARGDDAAPQAALSTAVLCALSSGAFLFLYELFMVGCAGRLREQMGEGGVRLFSSAMVINTVLCTVAGVWAARTIQHPIFAFPVGTALTGIGATLALMPSSSTPQVLVGALLLTLGEVVFAAVASSALLQLIQGQKRRGATYSGLLVLQELGSIAGGAAAFPLVVRGSAPTTAVLTCTTIAIVVAIVAAKRTQAALEAKPVVGATATAA